MKIHKYIFILLFIGFLFIGCEDRTDLTEPTLPSTGNADFSKFVSIGNSLTAGYQSGALFETAQNNSFGKLIANQVGVNYIQPTVSDPGIGGRIDAASVNPFSTKTQPADAGSPTNLTYEGIYNNLGIPGALLPDILFAKDASTALDKSNPFYDIVLRNQGKSALELAVAMQPTIATLWIGNNDILGYATSGGTLPHTPTSVFALLYDQLCGSLAQANVPVVLANIPDVTSIPFFTTVGGKLYLQGVTAVFGTKSDGAVVPMDLTKNFLTLKAQEELAVGKGSTASNPLSNAVILDEDEIKKAKDVTAAFNNTISSIATKYGFHLVNINSFFNNIATNGFNADGIEFSTLYVSGGIFSLDGVHPTSQGYAIVANEFIKVINDKFSASIPEINISTIAGSIELGKKSEINLSELPIFEQGMFNSIFY